MKKIKRLAIFVIMTVLAAATLCGCNYKGYEGEHPALYAEAINSILGISGFYDSPSLADSYIDILETDDNGRVMYMYRESGIVAICIAQKHDSDYVYYYPDFNFILAEETNGFGNKKATEIMNDCFAEDDIANLKSLNDFNQEFNENKCIKTKIITKKNSPTINKKTENQLETLCKQYAKDSGCKGEDSVYRYANFCTYDDYGRMLFYIWGVHRDVYGEGISPSSTEREFRLAIIFNPDWSYDTSNTFFELEDMFNYQNDLKEFKQLHNWNQPL